MRPIRPSRREFLKAGRRRRSPGRAARRPRGRQRHAPGRPDRLRRPRHRRGQRRRSRPTRTSSSSPWPTPSRTACRSSLETLQGRREDRGQDRRQARPTASSASTPTSKLLASGVDVVLLCTPPHFRPMHLKAAVEAGKHVFAEKPVAVDAPGVRSVLETLRGWRRRRTCRSSPASASATTTAFARPSSASTTARSARCHALQANDYRSGRWAKPRQPGLDRHALADAQLVLLHLAVGRLQRRAARPLSSTSAPG